MEIRNEKEERLRAVLSDSIVNLSFRKLKTDEIRHMTCTLNDEYVPKSKNTKPERKEPEGLITVYDLDVKGWRRFYADRVIEHKVVVKMMSFEAEHQVDIEV